MRWLYLLTCLAFLYAMPAQATTYWIDADSHDCTDSTGSGTEGDPWNNAYHALSTRSFSGGDVINLKGGTYRASFNGFSSDCMFDGSSSGTIGISVVGASGNPVIIQNAPGETVLVNGTDWDFDGATWTACGTSSYSTPANVGSNGQVLIYYKPADNDAVGTVLDTTDNITGSCTGLAEGEVQHNVSGTDTTYVRLPGSATMVNDEINYVGQAGDASWATIWIDSTAQFLTIRANPEGGAFYVKYGYNCFLFEGHANAQITVDGLKFIGCGGRDFGHCVRALSGEDITFQRIHCETTVGEGIAFYGGGPGGGNPGIQMDNINLLDSTVLNTGIGWRDAGNGNGNNLGASVIVKNCSNCNIERNDLSDNVGQGAVFLTTSTDSGLTSANAVVNANIIHNFGLLCTNSCGQQRTVAGIVIEAQNSEASLNNALITNNMIHNSEFTASAAGEDPDGIHIEATGGVDYTGIVVANNSMNEIQGECIYVNIDAVVFRNNVMDNCTTTGGTAAFNNNSALDVHTHTNNTYWAANATIEVVENGGTFYNRTEVVASWEASAVQADPLFVSTTDLSLDYASPMIDAGTATDCPSVDFFGSPRPFYAACDIGGYEMASSFCSDDSQVKSVAVSVSASGNTQLVALASGEVIYVCGWVLFWDGTLGVQLIEGTGSACATGETDLTGDLTTTQYSGASAASGGAVQIPGTISNALCIELSAATAVNGYVTYVQKVP